MEEISLKTAFKIGVCQIFAMIPGVSRAGASLVGAQWLGVERKAAAEFSFFLAIPTIFGAAFYDLFKSIGELNQNDLPIFAVGTLFAFLSALIVVKKMIAFVGKYGFRPFAYYRIVFGSIVLLVLHFGWSWW
jgi:undecaprenyl-diphosphatase